MSLKTRRPCEGMAPTNLAYAKSRRGLAIVRLDPCLRRGDGAWIREVYRRSRSDHPKSRRRGVVRLWQVTRREFVDAMRMRIAVKDEAPVAIAAFDIALLVDLQPHARMTKSGGAIIPGGTDIAGPIAGYAAGIGMDGFRGCAHALPITKAARGFPVGMLKSKAGNA